MLLPAVDSGTTVKLLHVFARSHAAPENELGTSRWFEVRTAMGFYGAPTLKPTSIFGNFPDVSELGRNTLTHERGALELGKTVQTAICNEKGVTGCVASVHASQIYTPGYGRAVFDLYTKLQSEPDLIDATANNDHEDDGLDLGLGSFNVRDQWEDTGIQYVCELLNIPFDRMMA